VTGIPVGALVESLQLESKGDGRYLGQNVDMGHGVVFGGQLMAQALVAGQLGHSGGDAAGGAAKAAETLHVVFARAARPDVPLDIVVEPMHAGRTLASSTVTISQGDRLCVRAVVLLTVDEPDVMRHADPAPAGVAPPADALAGGPAEWQVVVVDDVDVSDPALVGPPDLDVWTRFPGAPDDPITAQALLAFATDGFLIGTAMRPHAGVGQSQAHVTLTTGVLSHTLSFHEPTAADGWLLLRNHSAYAGRGRTHGSAQVFAADGALVASYVQDAMVRAKGDGAPTGAL
jgi:acyl-CoA thioesterase